MREALAKLERCAARTIEQTRDVCPELATALEELRSYGFFPVLTKPVAGKYLAQIWSHLQGPDVPQVELCETCQYLHVEGEHGKEVKQPGPMCKPVAGATPADTLRNLNRCMPELRAHRWPVEHTPQSLRKYIAPITNSQPRAPC